MKNHLERAFVLLPLVFLCSCGAAKNPDISAYFNQEELTFHEGYKVLQLTDIHWSSNTDVLTQGAYLQAVVKAADPDFVMITGDCLLGATTATAQAIVGVFESFEKPFAVTWGNHDREGEYSPRWLSNLFKNAKNSFYNEVDDNVFGRSNYVISLKDSTTGKPAWNLYSIDSNSYPESQNGLYYNYDIIHDDQIAWFEKAAAASASQNGGNAVPALAYFHIPLWEWSYAFIKDQKGLIGEVLESSANSFAPAELQQAYKEAGISDGVRFWPGYRQTTFFDVGVKAGVKGFFCGHDHSNDWGTSYTSTAGTAYVGYGVKSGKELYYAHSEKRGWDIIGGSLTTLHANGKFDLTHYYVQTDSAYTVHTEEVTGL
jgi:3',5'-cyclic AMP phosphodiesterase CpdA